MLNNYAKVSLSKYQKAKLKNLKSEQKCKSQSTKLRQMN